MFKFFIMILLCSSQALAELPDGFVELSEIDSSIDQDIRYYGKHNFLGERVEGYRASKCILTSQAAQALKKVQAELKPFGVELLVYDCYRPQKAVDHFVRWAKNLTETSNKDYLYPDIPKNELFERGYIAKKSGHSRGSTVDLSIRLANHKKSPPWSRKLMGDCRNTGDFAWSDGSLDMGTTFDCFDRRSHTAASGLDSRHYRNRLLLKSVMERFGFENYPKEWWHFTLKNEPFKDKYFQFEIK